MKKFCCFLLTAALLLGTLSGCGAVTPSGESGLRIVCTIFPEYDWCRVITGGKAEITLLLDSGMDLHNYEPNAQDIAAIAQSNLLVYVGGTSDGWVTDAVQAADSKTLMTFSMSDYVTAVEEEHIEGMQEEHEEHEEEGTEYDEHVWLSLKNAAVIVQGLCDTLCKLDAQNADTFRANTSAYLEKLTQLDADYAAAVEGAARTTILVADRFPFRYLADDYGLTYYAAFPGCAAASDVSFETVSFLSEKVRELSLPVIFMIDGSDGEIAQTVAENAGTSPKLLTLDSCQCVTDEELKGGTTYYDIMYANLEILKEALN